MPLINKIIDNLLAKTQTFPNENNYINEVDNLLYCGNCNTPKQCRVDFLHKKGAIGGCTCSCEKERLDKEKQDRERTETFEHIENLRKIGLSDNLYKGFTFTNDDGKQPQIAKAKAYFDNWSVLKDNNAGLLLWGGVGTGKSYFAGCIANALIDNCVPVRMTNFATILNTLSGMYSEEKNHYIGVLGSCELLIIDDFGIERKTEYALEQIYNVIDYRYRTMKPLIITTNLSLNTLKNPADTSHARIYSRILEMCLPIYFEGGDRREQIGKKKLDLAKSILSE